MLTAAEALKISCANDPGGIVTKILSLVEAAANQGDRSIQYRGAGFGDSAVYNVETQWPKMNQLVVKRLRDLGYSAHVRCEERQFVDLWLEVSW